MSLNPHGPESDVDPVPEATPTSGVPGVHVSVSVVLISAAMLMFEILQTIVLALQTIERNAFLVISLCLLGLGSGGSIAALLSKRATLSPRHVLWWSAVAFGAVLAVTSLASSWTVHMPTLIVLGIAPYVFVGLYLSFLFKAWPGRANRLYFLNLVGSGLGCLGLVWILNGTGDAGLTILIIALIAVAAGAIVASSLSRRNLLAAAIVATLLLMLIPFKHRIFGFLPAPEKGMAKMMNNPRISAETVWSKWGYLGRLDVVKPGTGIEHFRREGPRVKRILDKGCDLRYLFASGGNWTKSIHFKQNHKFKQAFTRNHIHRIPYVLTDEPDVLNIGFGGGVDIFLALQSNARSVVGVEINPLMIKAGRMLMRGGYYDDFYNDPRVIIKMMDGRTYVRNTSKKFDVISLTAVDTGALIHSTAFILVENYLYTQEAFDRYVEILKDDGLIYVYRPTQQALRVAYTAVQALRHIGVPDPEDHFAVLGKGRWGPWRSVLVSRSPLTPEQMDVIEKRAGGRVDYLPRRRGNTRRFESFFASVRRDAEYRQATVGKDNYVAVTDDRPFFYQFGKGFFTSEASKLLLNILSWVMAIAVVLILLPMFSPGMARKRSGRRAFEIVGYFASIGLGFMFIEVCLIQKLVLFLGHPSYSITVTLFAILIFSGLGSITARRFVPTDMRTPLIIWGPIVTAALFYVLFLGPVLSLVHTESLAARIVIVTLLLAPGSFFMGMPFPTMIRLMGARDDALIPWAWAVNAFTSVAASVLTILFAIHFGFSVVLYFGIASYLVALGFYILRTRRAAA